MKQAKDTRYVFWTSGWDSTYMVIKLLRNNFIVQPIYIINPKRKSRHHELASLNRLSELISQHISTGKLLPYKTFNLSEIKPDAEVDQVFDCIMKKMPEGQRPLGYQYRYLASFARQHPEFPIIGLGLEKALNSDQCACSAVIRQFGKLTKDGRIDESSAPELIALLGRFDFPIMDTTEPEMVQNIKSWGYEDIMQHIWFCHKPIRGQQCGFCNPCQSKLIGEMGFLLPRAAVRRHDRLDQTKKRYGKLARRVLGRFYRLRGC